MGYIVTQLSLAISTFFLSLGTLFGVSVMTPDTVGVVVGTTTAQVTKVIDGDTIDVTLEGQNNSIRIRYIGIDTPEPYANETPECGSAEATAKNKELVNAKTVVVVPGIDPYDKYDRLLAYVYVDDTFVNEVLVEEGYATVLMMKPNTAYENKFRTLYKNARVDKRGIWAVCE